MLLAFAEAKRYPKIPPGLDTELGWLAFALLACIAVWAWTRFAWIKRVLFAGEDPRIFAGLRIMLAVATIGCFWNLEPYWHMLWSDEGVFTLAEARQRLGRSALSGWSVQAGFFDAWAVAKFLWEKPSLFLLRGEPAYVDQMMWVYFGLLVVYALGFRTRVTGLLCWIGLAHVYGRNALYLEGTDTVYRVLWFIMLFARTDRAWSIDNWLRCKRARRRAAALEGEGSRIPMDLGLLADRLLSIAWGYVWVWLIAGELGVQAWLSDGPAIVFLAALVAAVSIESVIRTRARFAEGAQRYLLVSRWPRLMIAIQFGFLYTTTGWVKTGAVWARGDALWYAMNMDHFYRFGGVTQWVSAYLGTNLFRIGTWITHFWENCFFLTLVGMWLAFRWRYRERAWSIAADASAIKRWVRRSSLAGMWALLGIIFYKSIPFIFALNKKGDETMSALWPTGFAWTWGLGVPLLVLAFGLLKWWAPTLRIPLGRGAMACLSLTFDADFLRRWLLGRRVWLTCGVAFHGVLILAMNIGWFPLIMLGGYLCFIDSREMLIALRFMTPKRWRDHEGLAAPRYYDQGFEAGVVDEAEAHQLGRRGDALIPSSWVLLWLGAGLAVALSRPEPLPLLEPWTTPLMGLGGLLLLVGVVVGAHRYTFKGLSGFSWGWTLAAVGASCFFMAYAAALSPEASELSKQEYAKAAGRALKVLGVGALVVASVNLVRRRKREAERPHLLGNSLTRTVIVCALMWHTAAITTKLMPNFPIWGTWQSPSRRVVGSWLRATKTTQSWRMFAPNPPRSNSFMKSVLIDAEGVYWDLGNNSLDSYPDPFWVNDRMRKMQRRMVGKGKWYLRYWTAYHCRLWEFEHNKPAQALEIYKVTTRIPPPNKRINKPWNARKQKRTTTFVQRHACGKRGRPTPVQKRRRGLELDEKDLKAEAQTEIDNKRDHESRTKSWARRRDFGGDRDSSPSQKATFKPTKVGEAGTVPVRRPDATKTPRREPRRTSPHGLGRPQSGGREAPEATKEPAEAPAGHVVPIDSSPQRDSSGADAARPMQGPGKSG